MCLTERTYGRSEGDYFARLLSRFALMPFTGLRSMVAFGVRIRFGIYVPKSSYTPKD